MRFDKLPGTCALCVALVLLPMAAIAEEKETLEAYAVPNSPALTFIGATPAEITQPTSGRQFLTELLNSIDPSGKVQQGLAFNTQLWYVLPRPIGQASIENYNNPFPYAWANLELSLGTVKTAGADGNTDLSIGARTLFYDESDPLRDPAYQKLIADTFKECLPAPGDTRTQEEREAACEKILESRYKEKFPEKRWNATRLSLAAATGLRLRESLIQNTGWLGFSTWFNGSLRLCDWGQVILQARYDRRAVDNASIVRGGARFNAGKPTFNGFAEALVGHDFTAAEAEASNTGRWAVGAEYRITKELWLSASLGNNFSITNAGYESGSFSVLSALKWNVTTAPEFSPEK